MKLFMGEDKQGKDVEILGVHEFGNGDAYVFWRHGDIGVAGYGLLKFHEGQAYMVCNLDEQDMLFLRQVSLNYEAGVSSLLYDRNYDVVEATCVNTVADFHSLVRDEKSLKVSLTEATM